MIQIKSNVNRAIFNKQIVPLVNLLNKENYRKIIVLVSMAIIKKECPCVLNVITHAKHVSQYQQNV